MKAKAIENQYKLTQKSYYPFGMQMPGRSFSSPSYRYGFNGMEKDDEVTGAGGSYTTMFRQLDTRLARWWSVDPVVHPWQSPYTSMDNMPIVGMDPFGADCETCPEGADYDQYRDSDHSFSYEEGMVLASEGATVTANRIPEGASVKETYEIVFDAGYDRWGNDYFKEVSYQQTGEEVIDDGLGNTTYEYHVTYVNNISPWARNTEYGIVEGDDKAAVHRTSIIEAAKYSNSEWYEQNERNWEQLKLGLVTYTMGMNLPVIRTGAFYHSLDDILANPSQLRGLAVEEVKAMLRGTPGWKEGVMLKSKSTPGGGWTFRELAKDGVSLTGKYIQYHPGTSRHFGGAPYWKVSTGDVGTVRVLAF